MSQNTRLLLIALVVMVVFGIFLQSLIAKSLQESNGGDASVSVPKLPTTSTTAEPLPGIAPVPGSVPVLPGGAAAPKDTKPKQPKHK
jgi:hypothetical protein